MGWGLSVLYAAKLATKANLKVLLLEQNPELGGEKLHIDHIQEALKGSVDNVLERAVGKSLVDELEKLNSSNNLKICLHKDHRFFL